MAFVFGSHVLWELHGTCQVKRLLKREKYDSFLATGMEVLQLINRGDKAEHKSCYPQNKERKMAEEKGET